MAKEGFWARLFGADDNTTSPATNDRNSESNSTSTNEATLSDVIAFLIEIRNYYDNDITRMRTSLCLMEVNMTESEERFTNKKIRQEEIALAQIDKVLAQVRVEEEKYRTVFKKSMYSFFDEVEDAKLAEAQTAVLGIIIKLCEINTKPELDNVIRSRIESYRQTWNISTELDIPQNYNPVLVDEEDGIETYRFGKFTKKVKQCEHERTLTPKQLQRIRTLKIGFEKTIETDVVWVRVSSVTRAQLNLMKKTCIFENDWEHVDEEDVKLTFDVVRKEELEQYLKGILQIVLPRRNHAVISIFIPTNNMLRIIGPVKELEQRVEIEKKFLFIYRERSLRYYNGNLMTDRIDRRHLPEDLYFISLPNFRKAHF